MVEELLHIAEAAIKRAVQRGADAAEAYVCVGRGLTIEVRHGQLETLKEAQEKGIGLRVIRGARVGFAFGTDLALAQIADLIDRALAAALYTEPDAHLRLPEPAESYAALELYDPAIEVTPLEEKIALARRMEEAALAFDKRVKVIEVSTYQEERGTVAIANSCGIRAAYQSAACGLYISLAAEQDGQSETGYALYFGRRFGALDPEGLGREAATRAVRLLGSRTANTCTVPVVFDPYVAVDIIGLLGPALTAEAVQRRRSLFAGKVGQQVGAGAVNLIDDGTYPGGLRTAPFDGEGVPARRTVLVKEGVLQGFLYDTYTAGKEGRQSTGNAVRGSFRTMPSVGTTNFYLEPGNASPAELVGEISQGLYVMEVMGMHTANPISGDFSIGAAGIWIENGAFSYPVRGVVIAGNMLELLRQVDGVGADLRFFGGRGAPTFRVAALRVSGK